ncbi:flavin-dependent dehydrogenase [Saccharomonospora marina XMU15]|uniref:Flavin-dependent dehydrogenase n=1 Tax=Saccharomonospora marina XMU15 TaxID=882083 RepID=H5X6R2_9PSEU|nr:FAD-dependent monooxygenase [Saccharomonospora marina]EHR51283.1 flavin-dependent dehydrogenase [Saccharomonospora marina XMU15]
MTEYVDAVVVGARCAGSAAAVALARAGRRVVAVDSATFPSDTLSTHLLFAGGVAELAAIGALPRVHALGPPRLTVAEMTGAGITVRARYTPVDGIDHGLCVRRTGLDAALTDTAREAGAQVREATKVTDLLWDRGRVAGVRTRDRGGRERELRAPLVVGADGRRSTVARAVGAERPYRSNPNQRACLFAYWHDPDSDQRSVAAQWRAGSDLGTAFPCDDGLVMVLVMPPVERLRDGKPAAAYAEALDRLPGLRHRLRHCAQATKVRSTRDTTSYFRRSSGAGWALPGDSGHFKDPVTAQGIRDALRYGRLLGEAVAAALHDPAELDRSLLRWERRRERECLEVYQWTNGLARAEVMSPLEVEFYRAAAADEKFARHALDVFARTRRPGEVFTLRRNLRLATAALRRVRGRTDTLRTIAAELRRDVQARRARTALGR